MFGAGSGETALEVVVFPVAVELMGVLATGLSKELLAHRGQLSSTLFATFLHRPMKL